MTKQDPIIIEKRLRIKTLCSLHIGTGLQLGPKEYARQGQQIFVAKPEKLLALVRRSPRLENAFLTFCEDEKQTLTDFLRQQRIDFEDIAIYKVTAIGQVARAIPVFIKNFEGKPYLPGSSLKGVVRSALIRSRILADQTLRTIVERTVKDDLDEIRRQRNPNISYWRKIIGMDVERNFFGEDEHHDLMRCLQFGDSTTCEPQELRIAEVRALSLGSDGNLHLAREPRRPEREMRPVTPEVLPKNIEVVCRFTVNFYLLHDTPAVKILRFDKKTEFIKAWLRGCNEAAQDRIRQEIDFFTRHRFDGKQRIAKWYEALREQLEQVTKTDNQCLVNMAWGSGWDAKTVTDQFNEKIFNDVRTNLSLRVGRPSGSNTFLSKEDSPKSRKIVFENGQPKEPLGWVKLTLEEVPD